MNGRGTFPGLGGSLIVRQSEPTRYKRSPTINDRPTCDDGAVSKNNIMPDYYNSMYELAPSLNFEQLSNIDNSTVSKSITQYVNNFVTFIGHIMKSPPSHSSFPPKDDICINAIMS